MCVTPSRASEPPICCRDSSCAGRYAPPKDAGGTRPADAGAPRGPDAGAPAPVPSDASGPSADLGSPAGSDAGADHAPPPEDALAADVAPLVDTRPAEPPPQDDPALATGAKAYLRFDDLPQNQAFRDSSGNGNAATLHGADLQASLVEGRYDAGVRLSGGAGGGWLEMASSNSFNDIIHGVSIAAWIFRTPDDSGDGALLSRRSASGSGQLYVLEIVGDRLRTRINTAGGYNANLSTATQLPHGRWVHVAMTYDEHVVRLFVDGLERSSMPYALGLPPELTPILIGAAEPGTGGAATGRLAGTLDEVLLYGRGLTNREIAALGAHTRPSAAK